MGNKMAQKPKKDNVIRNMDNLNFVRRTLGAVGIYKSPTVNGIEDSTLFPQMERPSQYSEDKGCNQVPHHVSTGSYSKPKTSLSGSSSKPHHSDAGEIQDGNHRSLKDNRSRSSSCSKRSLSSSSSYSYSKRRRSISSSSCQSRHTRSPRDSRVRSFTSSSSNMLKILPYLRNIYLM